MTEKVHVVGYCTISTNELTVGRRLLWWWIFYENSIHIILIYKFYFFFCSYHVKEMFFRVSRTYQQFVQHATCKVSWRVSHIKTLRHWWQSRTAFIIYLTVMDKSERCPGLPTNAWQCLRSSFDLCSLIQTLTRPNLTPEQYIVGKPGHIRVTMSSCCYSSLWLQADLFWASNDFAHTNNTMSLAWEL